MKNTPIHMRMVLKEIQSEKVFAFGNGGREEFDTFFFIFFLSSIFLKSFFFLSPLSLSLSSTPIHFMSLYLHHFFLSVFLFAPVLQLRRCSFSIFSLTAKTHHDTPSHMAEWRWYQFNWQVEKVCVCVCELDRVLVSGTHQPRNTPC